MLEPIHFDSAFSKLRKGLLLPYALVIASVLIIVVVLYISSQKLNSQAAISKQDLFNTVVKNELTALGKQVRDYSWWNEAITNIIISYNLIWVNSNLQRYLKDTFGISRVLVLMPDYSVLTNIYDGEIVSNDSVDVTNPELVKLLQQASKADVYSTDLGAATGIVKIGRNLHLTAIHPFLAEDELGQYEKNKIYGFLVYTKVLDQVRLDEWAKDYQIKEIGLHTIRNEIPSRHTNIDILSPTGQWLASVSMSSGNPGDEYIIYMAPWIIGITILLIIVSALFVVRVNKYTEMTNDAVLEIYQSRNKLNELAYYDPLTGLANRVLAIDRLNQAVATSKRLGIQAAVLYIDLDSFKLINDTKGHHSGDILLQTVAQRMNEITREEDTVARMSGDEFCIIMPSIQKPADADTVANKINDCLAEPCIIDGAETYTAASIGIVIAPTDGSDAHELLKKADIAMYHAKQLGKNCSHFFTEDLNDKIQSMVNIRSQLRNAIKDDELSLVYQPIVRGEDRSVVGAEVLLRWNNQSMGEIPPSTFIPIAEDSGLIVPAGKWVLKQVMKDSQSIKDEYGCDFTLSINISSRQILEGTFIGDVTDIVIPTLECAPRINIEITEHLLLDDNAEVRKSLLHLSQIGIGISLDDFGTGYSSLSYLNKFPVDTIKIDRSFVTDIESSDASRQLVRTIIIMANNLNLDIIAEGVENEAQCKFLLEHGCQQIQGYLVGRPMPLQDLLDIAAPR